MTDNHAANGAEFERLPAGQAMDETDVSLRHHFARMSWEKLARYDANWTDERVIEWDGDFRNDGTLMLVCVERDVRIEEYRRVLEEHIGFRKQGA